MLNLEENNLVYKKNYLWWKKFSETLKSEACTKWEKWQELKNYELTKSQCKNKRKTMRQYKNSLLSCRKCKIRWILWMIRENFKKWNQITVGDCLTFPVNQQRFQVLVLCWAVTKACHLTHGTSGLQQNVFGNQFFTFDSHRDHPQGIHPCAPQREQRSLPQATGTETLFTWDDKQNRDTIPMPIFARRSSTMSSLILV